MPWAKVDDQWFAHRKVVGLSLAARGLWTTVLSWSCAQRSPDIPEHMVAFLAGGDDDAYDLALELVAAGLWVETDDGWRIHDWHDYQEKSLSERRAEAGRKGGQASGEARRSNSDEPDEANGKQTKQTGEANDEANGKQTKQTHEANDEAGTRPVPSRPDPASPPSSVKQRGAGKRRRAPEKPLDPGWQPNDRHAELASSEGVDLAREAAKFRDHAQANDRRQRDWDAAFSTWLRRAAEYGARASPPLRAVGATQHTDGSF